MAYSASSGAVISFSVDGAAASQRQIDNIAQSMGNLSNAVQGALRNLAATAGIGGGFVQVVALSDEYAKFTSQLRLATQSQSEYRGALEDVRRISHDAQAELATTGMLYARIANGTRELGLGQKQVADITEVVNLALKVSAATTEESASAQLQLSQAFAAGALRGEEFNAVNEAAPRLMQALAEGIGVPVGALKQMASEGKITSEVMAAVLPKSLEQLRNEAQQVQTIGGAFTNLKNRVLEYTATAAQSNGVVGGLTGSINLLANNLELAAGALTTLTAVKAANWASAWVTETYRKVAADQAARTATLAAAQADVARVQATLAQAAATQGAIVVAREEAVARLAQANSNILSANAAIEAATAAGAQSFAMRTLRLATIELQVAEASRSAMLAELAVLGQQQARVSAEITAARTAEAIATRAAATAQMGGVTAAGLAGRAVGLLGGPVGAIVTVLGLAATAWSVYGSRSEEANKKAAESVDASTPEIIENLEKQNVKLRERLALMKQGMPELAKDSSPGAERLASTLSQINALVAKSNELKAKGTELDAADQAQLYALGLQYNNLTQALQQNKGLKGEIDASGSALADLVEVRERLTGVDKTYLDLLGKLQTAREKGAIGEQEYIGLVSQLATETYKKSEAGKASASASQKEATAYQNLLSAVREKIAAGQLEANGYDKLAESQKLTIKLNDDIASGKIKRGSVEEQTLGRLIAERRGLEDIVASQKRAAKAGEDIAQMWKDYADEARKRISDAEQEADRNEELARTFGMTKSAIEAQTVARLEDQLAQHGAGAFYLEEIENLEKLIAAKKRSAAALGNLEAQEANKKAFDQMLEDAKRSSEQIAQALTDSIMRGGKNGAEYLKDLFRTLVLRPILSPIGNAVGSAVNSLMPGATSVGAGGSGLAGAAAAASNLYSLATGGMTLSGGLGSGFMGSLAGGLNGAGVGSGLTSSIGLQIGTSIADVVGPSVAGALSSGLGAIATALPWVGGALAVVGLAKAAFGHGDREYTSSTLAGSLGAGGFSGKINNAWVEKGGWFSSDRTGVDPKDADPALAAGLSTTYQALMSASTAYAQVLGLNADSIATRTQTISIALGKDEAANQKAIADFFVGVGDQMAKELAPDLDKFTKAGESASTTLQRLAADLQGTDQVAQLLGLSGMQLFGSTGMQSMNMREQLIDAAGGLAALAQQAQVFNRDFLTDAERLAPVAAALDKGLASLGLSTIPTTRDEFKALVQDMIASGATATETGANQLAAVLSYAEAFAQVHPQIDAVAEAAAKAAAEAEMAAAEAEKVAAAIQSLKDAASTLLAGVNDQFSALQKVVGREKAGIQSSVDAHTAAANRLQSLSQALHSAFDTIQSPEQKLFARAQAQAEIRADLLITKAGGILSDAQTESLKKALGLVAQDTSSQFSSYADYMRDLLQTQNDVAQLAGLTDDSLSVEQRSLDALKDQLARLDDIVANGQLQLDALNGQSIATLSLAQAMAGFQSSITSAQTNPVVSGTATISGFYQDLLGRAPDQAGLQYWQNLIAGGTSLDAIRSGFMESDEYKKLHPFAVGTNFVPETMPALVHQGERIIPAADNRVLMSVLARASSGGGVDVGALVIELKELRKENTQLRADLNAGLRAIASHTMETKDTLDKWDVVGQPATRTD